MTQETFIIFISIAAVFFAGAAVGQLLLRLQLARLHHINLRMDRKLLARIERSREDAAGVAGDDDAFQDEHALKERDAVRHEIDTLVNEIERS